MCKKHGVADGAERGETQSSPLAEFGSLDTCRKVMRAYELYRYNLFKEKYCKNGSITG